MIRNQSFLPTGLVFPLPFRPSESYKERPRAFGGNRSGGRKHAGCDLYAPVGTAVIAMTAGTLTRAVYAFYGGTFALEVDHGTFVARYGEIQHGPSARLRVGQRIEIGNVIGAIGQLNCYHKSMLHLELYDGTQTGPLTNRANPPYKRRGDLLDPTPFLDSARVPLGSKAAGGVFFA